MDIVMIVIDIAGMYIIGDHLRFPIMLQIRRETTFLCILRKKAETEEKKKKHKELKLKREEERKRAKVGAKQIRNTVLETELTQFITEPDVQPSSTKTSRSTTMFGITIQPFANEDDENEQPTV